jgi:hypothetical protein
LYNIVCLQVFSEIDVVGDLQMAAKKGSKLTALNCCQALRTVCAPLPTYQSWNVLKWQPDQVRNHREGRRKPSC